MSQSLKTIERLLKNQSIRPRIKLTVLPCNDSMNSQLSSYARSQSYSPFIERYSSATRRVSASVCT
jgi:hypothetical protein